MKKYKSILYALTMTSLASTLVGQSTPPGVSVPVQDPYAVEDEGFSLSLAGSFANRYVSEGIDNVPGSRFFFAEVVGSYEGFSLGLWYAEAFSDAYNEINVFGEYALEFDQVEIYAGINYLYYPSGADPKSWEFYTGIDWEVLPLLHLFAETFYDFDDVKGGFLELGTYADLPVPEIPMTLQPYLMLGIDYGFVSGVRRLRENNLQVGLEGELEVAAMMSLFANINYSYALRNLDNLDEGNVTWGTVGLRLGF